MFKEILNSLGVGEYIFYLLIFLLIANAIRLYIKTTKDSSKSAVKKIINKPKKKDDKWDELYEQFYKTLKLEQSKLINSQFQNLVCEKLFENQNTATEEDYCAFKGFLKELKKKNEGILDKLKKQNEEVSADEVNSIFDSCLEIINRNFPKVHVYRIDKKGNIRIDTLPSDDDLNYIFEKTNQLIPSVEDNLYMKMKLNSGLIFFSFISKLGPLLGFLGTILGVWKVFGKMEDASKTGGEFISQFAEGIHVALGTTLVGLIIGIFATALYDYFYQKTAGFRENISLGINNFVVRKSLSTQKIVTELKNEIKTNSKNYHRQSVR